MVEYAVETMLTRDDLRAISKLMDEKFKTELKPVKSKLNKLNKKLDLVVRFFDQEVITLRKRTDRMETHLHLDSGT